LRKRLIWKFSLAFPGAGDKSGAAQAVRKKTSRIQLLVRTLALASAILFGDESSSTALIVRWFKRLPAQAARRFL
jgi:hypothetical protein